MKKRDLFNELMDGIGDMQAEREGKITLREYQGEAKPSPVVTSQEIIELRKRHHMSQDVFAHCIRTKPATLKNWEQGKASPNPQAAMLIKLVAMFPDMLERMRAVR